MAKINGIRKRWMTNSLGVVLFVLLLSVTAFSVVMGSYYYGTMSRGLQYNAEYAVEYFGGVGSKAEYYQSALTYASNFDSKTNKMEMQFLDAAGTVQFSSFGLAAFSTPGTPDVAGALSSEKPQTTPWTGKNPSTGEHIMAVSSPLIVDGQSVGAVRYVTSLRLADRQLIAVVLIALAVGIAILALVYFSNLYFVKSIVEPVARITDTAKRIASGSYGIQMEKEHDDEIGDLIDGINDMSAKIKDSEKLKTEFISSVSHELRTPLTAINGWAETIQNGEVRDADDVKKGMGIIVSEARRLTNMVEELLEFSRLEDGRFTLSIEPVDIKAEFGDAVYTYREFFRKENVTLNYRETDEEIPLLNCDPERLRQVFCNLLDNAAKHGGAPGEIDAAVDRVEDRAVITIRDHGPGVPEDELPHVKTKFYKGSSKARGSGIGLAVCDEIVTRHGGELNIGNAGGGGCIVTISLPIET